MWSVLEFGCQEHHGVDCSHLSTLIIIIAVPFSQHCNLIAGFSSTPNSYEHVWDTTCYPPGAGVEGCRQVARRVHTLALVFQELGFAQHKTVAGPDPLCLQGDLARGPHTAWPQRPLAVIPLCPSSQLWLQSWSRSKHIIQGRSCHDNTVHSLKEGRRPFLKGSSHFRRIRTFQSHSPFPIFNFLCDFVRIWASCCDRNVLLITVSVFRDPYMPPAFIAGTRPSGCLGEASWPVAF